MINIKVESKGSTIKEIIISGHSGYDEKGKDIICSAVSAIATGTVNALEEITSQKPKYAFEDGYMLIQFENNDKSQIIAKTMIIQLKTIEESYKKYLKINS